MSWNIEEKNGEYHGENGEVKIECFDGFRYGEVPIANGSVDGSGPTVTQNLSRRWNDDEGGDRRSVTFQ